MSRRVVDCTKILRHGAADAFAALEFERAGQPRTLTHRIEMDADVGTHVLAPRRYVRWGSDLSGLAPETFFGEGLVAHLQVTADASDIDSNRLEDAFGHQLQNRDIVVIAARGEGVTPSLTAQAAQWLFVRGAKLVALADGISVGRAEEPDDERVILSTLLENDVPVVRGLVNTEALSADRMAFMALPAPAADITAWPVRFVALDPGLDPTQPAVATEPAVDQEGESEPTATADPADPPAESQPDEAAESQTVPKSSESDTSTGQNSADSPPESDRDEESAVDESSSEDQRDGEDHTRRNAEA
ncbi:MAG: cyclase family protein [Chloroflexota bacterium]|nr:cyclase family protein [Chloroflexota bacterium]MDE2899098.1 cyclase family protein [Chloroflexota bacterium]